MFKYILFLFVIAYSNLSIASQSLVISDIVYPKGTLDYGVNNSEVKSKTVSSEKYKLVMSSKHNNSYILKSVATSSNYVDNVYKVSPTNYTKTRTLSVEVYYEMIDPKTKQIIMSFNATGTGSKTIIIQNLLINNNMNNTEIISEANKNLSEQVFEKLITI